MPYYSEKTGVSAKRTGGGDIGHSAAAHRFIFIICALVLFPWNRAMALFPRISSAEAAEIDYQSLQENPVDTIFRRILTQEVPGWEDAAGEEGEIGAELSAIKWPLKEGRIAGLFNLRASKGRRRHKGVDLLAPRGTPIYAAVDGVVEVVSNGGAGWRGYGKVIFINHGGKFWSLYSHCDTIGVKIGQRVRQGEQIATVGRTGRASGYHLHFELRGPSGAPMDPMKYLPEEDCLPSVKR